MSRHCRSCLFLVLFSGIHLITGQVIHVPSLLPVPTVISRASTENGNGVVGVVLLPGLSGQTEESSYSYTDSVQGAAATAQVQSLDPAQGISNSVSLMFNPPAPLPTSSAFSVPQAVSPSLIAPSSILNSQLPVASLSSSGDANSSAILANVNVLPLAPSQFQLPTKGILTTASGKPIPCSPKSTHLNPTTHKFISECTESTFCLAPPNSPPNATRNGVCARRRCRRDMYPFGFFGTEGSETVLNASMNLSNNPRKSKKKHKSPVSKQGPFLPPDLPPICLDGTFCPDDGSGCLPQVSLGAACELARDEQCAMPPNLVNPSSLTTGDGKSAKPIPSRPRAICLDRTCM